VSYPIQRAAEAAYSETGKQQIGELIKHYMDNAKILRESVSSAGLKVFGGMNAPYIWVQAPSGSTSWDMFDRILKDAAIVITPGSGFGSKGEGYVGPSLREIKPVLRPDLFFKSVLKQGIPGSMMASWDTSKGGRLTAKDLDDLVSYIILWEHQGESGVAYHNGMKDCAICHVRPSEHRQGKCVFCHDTVDWGHAS
jgi:hypothetical protein